MKTIKAFFITLMCGLFFYPLSGFAVTPEENAANIKALQEELSIANENINDLNNKLSKRVKISGYADVEYETSSQAGGNEGFRLHHLSLFFTKSLSDKWQFFSEIEYEDAPNIKHSASGADESSGEILVEAVNFSYLWQPYANLRAGRFFTPAGIWSVNHYPPFVPTQTAPQHIKNIFPQFVDGIMVYGTMSLGHSFINYDLYSGNGEGNTGGRDGNTEKAVGLNVSMLLPFFKRFEIGATFYTDTLNEEKDQSGVITTPETEKTAQGLHVKLDIGRFILQMEYATADFDPATGDSTSREGFYAQLLYESEEWSLGLRHDQYDETEGDKTINSVFGNYFIDENLVVKLEHHLIEEAGKDENSTILSLGAYFTH